MFGGVGVYANGLFFALIDNDVLYLKGDEALKAEFEAVGSHAFAPFEDGKTMAYWTAPAEALDDQDLLLHWARKSLAVAARKQKPSPEGRGRVKRDRSFWSQGQEVLEHSRPGAAR